MWSISDESLLNGYATGDPGASAAFVRRFQSRIFGLAMTITSDRAVAEEVAQEVFVRAFRHAGAFDPRRARVATWLLSITRNLSIDALRVRRTDPMDPDLLVALPLAGAEPSPEDLGAMAVETVKLRKALAALPEEQKRAVLLASFYGRTAQEIATMDGVPLGTVKTRIRAAMKKLREMLSEEEANNDV